MATKIDDQSTAQVPGEDGDVTCPVCQDFNGSRRSVEAHITGKSDGEHKGKTGLQFRLTTPDGEHRMAKPQDPDTEPASEPSQSKMETGIPMPDSEGDGTETETETETKIETDTDTENDTESDGSQALFLAILVGVVIYLARATGNEDQMRDRIKGV